MPESSAPRLILAKGRERSLVRRHPWVFSGAVSELRGQAELGATVRVCSADGAFLAWAAYNPSSRIAARVWSFDEAARIDRAFFATKIASALALRAPLIDAGATAYRLVHAESDGLPGVVVDRYGEQLVLQATSAGARRFRDEIAQALLEVTGCGGVFERSEGEAMQLEGLEPARGVRLGASPLRELIIDEAGIRYALDLEAGHKTGFYLDQRDNRALVRKLAREREVLDAFCYSGGFALNAALGGARSVVAIDSSEPALELLQKNAGLNDVPAVSLGAERADVFEWLRKARDHGRRFDLIVLDPPKLAPTARLAERAARAYKDLNLLAFKLLRPRGLLFTFSCSGGVSVEFFQKIVASAAADARVDASFLKRLQAGVDHPVGLAFPEGEYLKGLLCGIA